MKQNEIRQQINHCNKQITDGKRIAKRMIENGNAKGRSLAMKLVMNNVRDKIRLEGMLK